MKRFILFAISFVVLFSLFQVLSGMVLTFLYTPDVEGAWNMSGSLAQETVIKSNGSFLLTLIISCLAATVAYLIQYVVMKRKPSTD